MAGISSHRKLALCAGLALLLWHLPVAVAASNPQGWHVLAVFLASVVAFILRPLPMGAVVILALVSLSVTRTLSFPQVLAGYSDETVWLVVAAFLLAGNVIRSGLGSRIALTLVVKLGRSTLSLGYALCASELVLGIFIPSNTARGGGVLAPIARSLARALDSEPGASRDTGAFLMLVGAHANLIAAAMYLTGMAANPLIRHAALDVTGIDFGWGTWLLGSCVPALLSFAALPPLIARLSPPARTGVSAARQAARAQLAALGNWQRSEKVMAVVAIVMVLLWISKPWHGHSAALVAWMGLAVLLVTGTEKWSDTLANTGAWDALIWVGGILTMATQLRELGIVGWFAQSVQGAVTGLTGAAALLALVLVYFYSMYGFSMLTAHIAAMVAAFLGIAKLAGVPPLVAIAALAYTSNLCACLTPYSSGPVIIYFGQGYVSSNRWFLIGLLVSFAHLIIWLGVGGLWWKILGWW